MSSNIRSESQLGDVQDSESRWELAAVEHKLLQLERQHAHLAHRLRVEVFLKEELQDRALGAEVSNYWFLFCLCMGRW